MPTNLRAIGERAKRLREAHKLKQDDVALMLKLNRSTYKEKEDGRTAFSVQQIITLSELYGCSTDHLLKGMEHENQTVCEDLGLTEPAIRWLLMTANDTPEKEAIGELLGTPNGRKLLSALPRILEVFR
jgi:transcriptional regulator with XRE-family HTH domain